VKTWTTALKGDARESRWGIINGRAVCLFIQGQANELAWVDNDSADMDVRVTRNAAAGFGCHDTGIAFRVQDRSNFWAVNTRNDSSPTSATIDIWKTLAGSTTHQGTYSCPTTAWTKLRVLTSGTTITVYCDDLGAGWTQVAQKTSQSDLSSAVGAGLAAFSDQRARFDDFTVL
jgi:uncharacterized protein (DUF1501 family)